MQGQARLDLQRLLFASLRSKLPPGCKPSITCHVTPNRLCALVEGLPDASAGRVEERRGPRENAPERAVAGFARSAGVAACDLTLKTTKSGTYYFAVKQEAGEPIEDVVASLVPELVKSFPWPKSMRWGAGELRWVRPLNSILCILSGPEGSRTVEFAVGDLQSGNRTSGHRMMAPGMFEVRSFDDYRKDLRSAYVILDADERLRSIRSQIKDQADSAELEMVEDQELLEENAGLVEWPVVVVGEIDRRFRELPQEVVMTAMRSHLKFVSLRRRNSDRVSHFAAITNREARDRNKTILEGNRRVLAARLGDAEFAWNNDVQRFRKDGAVPAMRSRMDQITYHNRLGSLGQRVERIGRLAKDIVQLTGGDEGATATAAGFMKLDLLSETVVEFPELQGVIGRHLASRLGMDDVVGRASEEHHLPAGPDDRVPRDPIVVALALADRVDQVSGFFGIGLAPSGSKDPFALRRASLGIVRLVIENELRLPLQNTLAGAAGQFLEQGAQDAEWQGNLAGLAGQALDFIHERLVSHQSGAIRQDVLSACIAAPRSDDLCLLIKKARALQAYLETRGGNSLLQGYRRAFNILRAEKVDLDVSGDDCSIDLFEASEETRLHSAEMTARDRVDAALASGNAESAIEALSELVEPIDGFFENVRVNADDELVRINRIKLLARVRMTVSGFADLTQVGPRSKA